MLKCSTGKKVHATEERANEVLVQCKKQGRPEVRVYACNHCDYYHLSSQPYLPGKSTAERHKVIKTGAAVNTKPEPKPEPKPSQSNNNGLAWVQKARGGNVRIVTTKW